MATCKECVHVGVCSYAQNSNNEFEHCANFKDRSQFVELPCLPGDKVFLISSNEREIREYKVFSMPMMIAKDNHWFQINLENQRGAILGDFHFSDIGKTIFLSREEAEQALKECEENGY